MYAREAEAGLLVNRTVYIGLTNWADGGVSCEMI